MPIAAERSLGPTNRTVDPVRGRDRLDVVEGRQRLDLHDAQYRLVHLLRAAAVRPEESGSIEARYAAIATRRVERCPTARATSSGVSKRGNMTPARSEIQHVARSDAFRRFRANEHGSP